jgi:hypothetical protein
MALILTAVGAVLTTLLGVLVGSALSNRSQARQWSRDRQADACAQVLRGSSNVMIELAGLNGQGVEPAPDGVRIRTSIDWKPWNEALAMVNLVADHDIVEAGGSDLKAPRGGQGRPVPVMPPNQGPRGQTVRPALAP